MCNLWNHKKVLPCDWTIAKVLVKLLSELFFIVIHVSSVDQQRSHARFHCIFNDHGSKIGRVVLLLWPNIREHGCPAPKLRDLYTIAEHNVNSLRVEDGWESELVGFFAVSACRYGCATVVVTVPPGLVLVGVAAGQSGCNCPRMLK